MSRPAYPTDVPKGSMERYEPSRDAPSDSIALRASSRSSSSVAPASRCCPSTGDRRGRCASTKPAGEPILLACVLRPRASHTVQVDGIVIDGIVLDRSAVHVESNAISVGAHLPRSAHVAAATAVVRVELLVHAARGTAQVPEEAQAAAPTAVVRVGLKIRAGTAALVYASALSRRTFLVSTT